MDGVALDHRRLGSQGGGKIGKEESSFSEEKESKRLFS
jgi:hypothetical protein